MKSGESGAAITAGSTTKQVSVSTSPENRRDSDYKNKVRQPWYPAEEYRGLVFVYMGPLDRKPLLPRYDILEEDSAKYIAYRNYSRGEVAACNWLQLQENAADPVHTYILHGWNPGLFEFSEAFSIRPSFDYEHSDRHVTYVRKAMLENGNTLVRTSTIYVPTTRSIPPPQVTGNDPERETERARMVGWWVPVDDTHTVGFHVERIDPTKKMFQPPDPPPPRSYEETQRAPDDWEAQISQRPIAVHGLEHLATSDRGVALFRRRLREAIDAVERGEDPPGTSRDPDRQIVRISSRNDVIRASEPVG